MIDGWALRSLDLSGASSYSPVPLLETPQWVEAGNVLPEGCDCVLKGDLVDCEGPLAQAFSDAIPGEGIRRAGEDVAAGRPVVVAGRRLESTDLLVARAAGRETVSVRTPRVVLLDVAASDGSCLTTQWIAELLENDGAAILRQTAARDASSIANVLDGLDCDFIVTVGGTGFGHSDATAEALSMCGTLIANGLALRPGSTAAAGRVGNLLAVALPGAPDQAFAAYHALARPVLDRLAGRPERVGIELPLGAQDFIDGWHGRDRSASASAFQPGCRSLPATFCWITCALPTLLQSSPATVKGIPLKRPSKAFYCGMRELVDADGEVFCINDIVAAARDWPRPVPDDPVARGGNRPL